MCCLKYIKPYEFIIKFVPCRLVGLALKGICTRSWHICMRTFSPPIESQEKGLCTLLTKKKRLQVYVVFLVAECGKSEIHIARNSARDQTEFSGFLCLMATYKIFEFKHVL